MSNISLTLRLCILFICCISRNVDGEIDDPQISTGEPETTSAQPSTVTTTIATTTMKPSCGEFSTTPLQVTSRTSTSFEALIRYNCSFINSTDLSIALSSPRSGNCALLDNRRSENTIITVRCENIQKNAGRNVTFEIFPKGENDQIINVTGTITLKPLELNDPILNYEFISRNATSVSHSVRNCLDISELSYLHYRCGNASDPTLTPQISSNDCLLVCQGLTPGTDYTLEFIRSPIPYIDDPGNSSSGQSRNISARTDLDRVTNLHFVETSQDQTSGTITFTNPRGSYEQIELNCLAVDQGCSTESMNMTDRCPSCSSFNLPWIFGGVEYNCQISTIKTDFSTVISPLSPFQTVLRSVVISGTEIRLNRSQRSFSVINNRNDFEYLRLDCVAKENQTSVCSNVTLENARCSTTFTFTGTAGCDYQCSVQTIKKHYFANSSKSFNITVDPLKPVLSSTSHGSRHISLQWTFEDVTNIQSFDLYQNNRSIFSSHDTEYLLSQTQFFRNITTDLKPFDTYNFSLRVQSNREISSELISILTDQEAPPPPDPTTAEQSIFIPNDHPSSSPTSHYVEIDLKLFSDAYGRLLNYPIYIRRNQTDDTDGPVLNGTYFDALQNASIDYLVFNLIPPGSTPKSDSTNFSILLGNDTSCSNDSFSSPMCNGPLKPSMAYKLLIGGCTQKGCRYVTSKAFQTRAPIIPPGKPGRASLGWVAVFPILAVVALVGLAIWKRKPLKNKFEKIAKRSRKYEAETMRSESIVQLQSIYTVPTMKPKPLSKFVNVAKDEETIFAEFKELERQAHQYRRSEIEEEYAIYDRYTNIPARGPWEKTAVHLTGDGRVHDYINANEIQGFNREKEYIACQGPLEGTVEDFWHMIVQYRTTKIVMLTRTEERNPHNPTQTIKKCYAYFPVDQGQSLTFGNIVIRLSEIQRQATGDLEIRKIVVKSPSGEHRVNQYYFTGWPDFSVVDQRKLIDLIETVNRDRSVSTSPIVVHCSAGVGRTGTYIAVDILMKILDRPNTNLSTLTVDVMGVVQKMREDRAKMVQTKDQYMLIHRCVEEYLRRTDRLDAVSKGENDYENESSDAASSIYNDGTIRRSKRAISPNNDPASRKLSNASHRPSQPRTTSISRGSKDGSPQQKVLRNN